MVEIIADRVCAEVDGDITVFLIGMRINRPWKVWHWVPVFAAMGRMLRELETEPALGLLGARASLGLRNQVVLQYWKSADHLRAYAHARNREHLPAWRRFNASVGVSGDVGIWHETYVVPRGASESVFVNMPRFGLGLVGALFPATGRRASAAKRLGAALATDAEVDDPST